MDFKILIISIVFIIVGIYLMFTHKFYKLETGDMLFAARLKVFLGGLLFLILGIYALVSELGS